MREGHASTLHRNLQSLFDSGTCTGLSDAQLIDRFVDSRDREDHLAFETLVTRHGPMVLRVCRGILRDPHDAQDACQAVFLILAQRAGSIRNRDFLAGWLYRIAVRVAHRQRAIRKREAMVVVGGAALGSQHVAGPGTFPAYDESSEVIHEEVNRLDRNLREPVILCYFEGLSHDAAAERLHWPVGTVRSRLARARDRLRVRLKRRGLTGSGTGALGVWIHLDPSIPVDAASARLVDFVSNAPLPPNFVSTTVGVASRLVSNIPTHNGILPASSAVMALAKGVIQSMFYEKLMIATLGLVPLGVLAVGGGTILGQSAAPRQPVAVSAAVASDATLAPPKATTAQAPAASPLASLRSDSVDEEQRLHDLLMKRYETQRAFYEEGRITVDRYLDSIVQLGEGEKSMAKTTQDRIAAQARAFERVDQLLKRESDELREGKSTVADVSEIEVRRLQLDLELWRMKGAAPGLSTELKTAIKPGTEDDSEQMIESEKRLLDELLRYASHRYEVASKSFERGQVNVESLFDPIKQLVEVEKNKALTQKDRIAAQNKALERVTQLLDRQKILFKAGQVTEMSVNAVEFFRLQLELELSRMKRSASVNTQAAMPNEIAKQAKPDSGGSEIELDFRRSGQALAEITALKQRVSDLESKLTKLLEITDDKRKP